MTNSLAPQKTLPHGFSEGYYKAKGVPNLQGAISLGFYGNETPGVTDGLHCSSDICRMVAAPQRR